MTRALPLPTGAAIPLLGLGTWQLQGQQATDATRWALEAGYRHVDTATMYQNEREVGEGLRTSGVPRDEVFLTTKFRPGAAGTALDTLRASLEALDTDRVDLWLIHAPPEDGVGLDVWQAFLQAREEGLAVDVGVSNYSLDGLDRLAEATGVAPAVNQIRWSPLLFDRELVIGHRERGVVLEGYSTLRGGTLEHPVVTGIADRLGRTPAQVLVRWHLEHDTVVIPKSASQERIVANADVEGFTLSADDVAALDALGARR
jgi:diketogulonate reductase-like aldo/keto reductase